MISAGKTSKRSLAVVLPCWGAVCGVPSYQDGFRGWFYLRGVVALFLVCGCCVGFDLGGLFTVVVAPTTCSLNYLFFNYLYG